MYYFLFSRSIWLFGPRPVVGPFSQVHGRGGPVPPLPPAVPAAAGRRRGGVGMVVMWCMHRMNVRANRYTDRITNSQVDNMLLIAMHWLMAVVMDKRGRVKRNHYSHAFFSNLSSLIIDIMSLLEITFYCVWLVAVGIGKGIATYSALSLVYSRK